MFCLTWVQFLENIESKVKKHVPNSPAEIPKILAQKYTNDQYPVALRVMEGVCDFAAIELSAQPTIRNMMKMTLRHHATVTTTMTAQGAKDLDLFNQSYRVKTVQ